MVVTPSTLQLHAEERLRDRFGHVLRPLPILHEVQRRSVLDRVTFPLEQLTHELVIRRVLSEPLLKPLLNSIPLVSFAPRWIASEQQHVPQLGHVPRVSRIVQQAVDQLPPFLRGRIGKERNGLIVSWNHADKIERHAPQELGVARWFRRSDFLALPNGTNLRVDDLSQRRCGERRGDERHQHGDRQSRQPTP